MHFKKIMDLDLQNKKVFIRVDMNVPIDNGTISDDTRIKASLKTIQYALNQKAKVIIATHLGRPKEGTCTKEDSVSPIAKALSSYLNQEISVINNIDSPIDFSNQNIVMLENVRCNIGEKSNNSELGKKYASLCDIFVHDAFATAHRSEASTDAIGQYAKQACAGILFDTEINALEKALSNPQRPILAIVAGSKVSNKLTILNNLATKVDYLIVGGGILNTFLLANGNNVGKSLVEPNLVDEAKSIIQKIKKRGSSIPLPTEIVTSKEFDKTAEAITKNIQNITNEEMILDIGNNFAQELAATIKTAGTIIWNGPMGVFEFDQFANGTKIIANAIANSNAYSLAGGGDTISAINQFNLYNKISYVSTAGGALLEYLEGKELPALTLLKNKS